MCFRIAETMESPQEVEITNGNHENCLFQANLSQNPGWTPQSNHEKVETTGGWTPQSNHRRVETTGGWKPWEGNHGRVDTTELP